MCDIYIMFFNNLFSSNRLTYEIYPSREDINFQRMYFIENVILQTGFYKGKCL